ncbi:MAG: double zinc ribbon domain-containing protein [bacterium]
MLFTKPSRTILRRWGERIAVSPMNEKPDGERCHPCPFCDAPVDPIYPFCKDCGRKLNYCKICGKPLPPTQEVCSQCMK